MAKNLKLIPTNQFLNSPDLSILDHLWGEFEGTHKTAWIGVFENAGFLTMEELKDSGNQTSKMNNMQKVDEYYFTLACFILLSLGEDF